MDIRKKKRHQTVIMNQYFKTSKVYINIAKTQQIIGGLNETTFSCKVRNSKKNFLKSVL